MSAGDYIAATERSQGEADALRAEVEQLRRERDDLRARSDWYAGRLREVETVLADALAERPPAHAYARALERERFFRAHLHHLLRERLEGPDWERNGHEPLTCSACEVVADEWVERWRRQVETPYEGLTEREKESDRAEVRKTLAAIKESGE